MPVLASAEDLERQWKGLYKGVCSLVAASGEKTAPRPIELNFNRTGSDGFVWLDFSEGSNELKVTILNLNQRKENSPPTVTKERFHLPAIFADPTEFEANVVEGGFGENLITGTIITYKLSLDNAPEEEMRIIFKAGRLRK